MSQKSEGIARDKLIAYTFRILVFPFRLKRFIDYANNSNVQQVIKRKFLKSED